MLPILSIYRVYMYFQVLLICLLLIFFRYEVKDLTFDEKEDIYGIVINFNEDVQIKTSHWTINLFTMIGRIGGIIGVGQTITWIFSIGFEKLMNFYNVAVKE